MEMDNNSFQVDVYLNNSFESSINSSVVYNLVKDSTDIILSLIGTVISIPILIAAVILIRLESEGPVIYTQERVGKGGRLFKIYKLRTMYADAEKNGIQWAQRNDPRITRIGRYLRKIRIDELPQFINVLKGEMSIVGPRPERPHFVSKFSRELPGYQKRLSVKPGLTGWSQINGGYELSPEEKLEKDMFYIKNQSILMDIRIMLKTVVVILTFDGAR